MKKKPTDFILPIVMLWILIGIIRHPGLSIDSGYKGLLTWFNIIIPSLLPFFIISEILINMGIIDIIGNLLEPLMKPLFNASGIAALPLSMSIVSGYPVGAKIVSSLRTNKFLSKSEAEKALCFSSTSGPLFMLGAVSIGMLNTSSIAPLLMYSHYLGALTIGLLLRFYKTNTNLKHNAIKKLYYKTVTPQNNPSIGAILSNSIVNSINTIALIGGFVIFYSVLTELMFASAIFNTMNKEIVKLVHLQIDKDVTKGFVAGLLEITTGCSIIANASVNPLTKILTINFLIGWGGLSIHSQVISLINGTDIDYKMYLIAKLFHGIFSTIYGLFLYLIKYKNIIIPSYSSEMYIKSPSYADWSIMFFASFKLAFSVIIYVLIIMFIILTIHLLLSWD